MHDFPLLTCRLFPPVMRGLCFACGKSAVGVASLLALLFCAPALRADDFFVWAEEVDGNVVFHHEGSIDLTGFPIGFAGMSSASINPSEGVYIGSDGPFDIFEGTLSDGSTRPFGAGNGEFASSSSGASFALESEAILLPSNYVSGTSISGSATFNATTLASLGVDTTPFTFDTTVGTNTIHMFTKPPVVDNSAARADLLKQIKKLKKKAKKLKKKGKKAAAKKLGNKAKKLQAQLAAPG